jgi:hypothetical protein
MSKKGHKSSTEEVVDMPVSDVRLCPECGAPDQIIANNKWLNSGVIVLNRDETQRQILVESENLDPLFFGIGEIIGMPIDRQVIDVCRRSTRNLVGELVPQQVKDLINKREIDLEPIIMGLTDVMITASQIVGFGKFEHVAHRYERDGQDYFINRCFHPYSLPLSRGNLAGTIEGIYKTQTGVEIEEIGPDVYEMTALASGHALELEERLKLRPYIQRGGDIELERCSACGSPAALSSFHWDLEGGIITNESTGRRMTMMAPAVLEAVFEELEVELGDIIPQAVVEAQRRFILGGAYSIDEISDEGDFRTQLAVRGYGDLREIYLGSDGLDLRIDNAAAPLMIVGLAQGLFETALAMDSDAEWKISPEGDLEVGITPRGTLKSLA